MSEIHSRLGRGLGSMVSEVSTIRAGSAPAGGGFLRIPFSELIEPAGGREADATLIESVRKYGVLQPVLVARSENQYTLLAGSRRVQAARAAGLADVPALIVPPDRAGALDVFLEENLTRADLDEADREKARDRWMRETGRDAALAGQRIPNITNAPASESHTPSSTRLWQIATALLSILCIGLALMVMNATPVDERPVVIPVEFVDSSGTGPVGPPDNSWMEAFAFPGSSRTISGGTLELDFGGGAFEAGRLNARGQVILNQLAAVSGATEVKPRIELLAEETAARSAADHLIREGVPADLIMVRSAGPGAPLKVTLTAK